MKIAASFFLSLAVAALVAAEAPPPAPATLAPYVVRADAFGTLGIRRVGFHCDFLRMITGRNYLRFVGIEELAPGSPADQAGVHVGDRVVVINGTPVGEWSMSQLKHWSETLEIGQRITAGIMRPSDQTLRTVEAIVARPAAAPPS